jgi:hypothetical protein
LPPPSAPRPEFLNRLDEIIVFRQLTKKEVKQIADIMLRDVYKRGEEKGIKIEVTEKFKDRLVDEGFNPAYGARPLRRWVAARLLPGWCGCGCCAVLGSGPPCPCHRCNTSCPPAPPCEPLPPAPQRPAPCPLARSAIMRFIEDCLAERILTGDIKEGDVVIMDVEPDGAIAVLAGDRKMRQTMDSTPAGIA